MAVSNQENPDHYPRTDRPGTCVILNHTLFNNAAERQGTHKDEENVIKAFEALTFKIHTYHDLTTEEIQQCLKSCAENYETGNSDCLVVVALTHGDYSGLLYSRDGLYHKSLLWKPFLRDNCPQLKGKPKIFFIQACRGDKMDNGVTIKVAQTDSYSGSNYKLPPEPDFCIFYSTVEGEYSWRNTSEGSWFIQILSEELQSNEDSDLDLIDVMQRVSYRVAMEKSSQAGENSPGMNGMKQMPSIVCTLTKSISLRKCKETNTDSSSWTKMGNVPTCTDEWFDANQTPSVMLC